MEEAIQLDTTRHAIEVLAKFNSFREQNKYCDLTLQSGGEEIPVHACVVAANSDYFDIKVNFGVLKITEADPACIKKCVDFMYTGKASVSDDMREKLLHAAHLLKLRRLCDGIGAFFGQNLNCESFFTTQRIANNHECGNLMNVCKEFALTNFKLITAKKDFKTLDLDFLNFLLSSDHLKHDDGAKCKAIMNWINNDSSRAAYLFDLMKGVNFHNVPLSYRMFLLTKEERLFSNAECAKHIVKSIMGTQDITPHDYVTPGELGIVLFDATSVKLQRFNVERKNWTEMQALPPNNANHCSAVVVDEYIYAIVWDRTMLRLKYGYADATWETMASPSISSPVATVFEGYIYLTDDGTPTDGIERYNPTQNTWSMLPAKRLKYYSSCLAAASGRLYVMGGYGGGAKDDVESFTFSTSEWETVTSMTVPRYYASAVASEGLIYVFGGYNASGNYESSMESYCPDVNAWTVVNLSNFVRTQFSSWSRGGKIYLVGGNQSGKKTIDEYDTKTNIITKLAELDDIYLYNYSSVAVLM